MEKQKLEEFKENFLQMKSDFEIKKDQIKGEFSTQLGDEIDQMGQERERELLFKLKGRDRFFLKKLDAALERIEAGTFGECLECGGDISDERLKARPTANLCIDCKENEERFEDHIPYKKKSHTHGQEIQNKADNVLAFMDKDKNQQNVRLLNV